MEKLIVYGLGKAYEKIQYYVDTKYEVVALCDKRKIEGAIVPNQIKNINCYDKIFVTSEKYFTEIKNELVHEYGILPEKIIGQYDILGNFENEANRHAWIKEKLALIPKDKIILDAGAGEQRYRPFCSHLKYIAQDFGEYVPDSQKYDDLQFKKWDYSGLDIKCDITNIPLPDNSVDVVLCTEVFEHLPKPILAVKEFSRLLSGGGVLLLTAPFCSLTHMAPYYFYNGFSEFWYKKILEENGFEILEIKQNGNFFKYLSQELMRSRDMVQKYCGVEMVDEDFVSICEAIKVMTKYSALDSGSQDTLCFGYMIEAVKK